MTYENNSKKYNHEISHLNKTLVILKAYMLNKIDENKPIDDNLLEGYFMFNKAYDKAKKGLRKKLPILKKDLIAAYNHISRLDKKGTLTIDDMENYAMIRDKYLAVKRELTKDPVQTTKQKERDKLKSEINQALDEAA